MFNGLNSVTSNKRVKKSRTEIQYIPITWHAAPHQVQSEAKVSYSLE
jgi:hypothetical protein